MPLSSIQLANPPPPSHSGELLIVGGGRCVWEDVRGLPEMDVMTVNDILQYWPGRVRHAYSNDDEQLRYWAKTRRRTLTQQYGGFRCHTIPLVKSGAGIETWPFPGRGSSALPACYVGLALGYESIILAGCPLDDSGHFYDPPADHPLWKGRKPSNFTNEGQERLWVSARDHVFDGRVRSLSGRSKEILNDSRG